MTERYPLSTWNATCASELPRPLSLVAEVEPHLMVGVGVRDNGCSRVRRLVMRATERWWRNCRGEDAPANERSAGSPAT